MAKQKKPKTKNIPFSNTATFNEDTKRWEWCSGGIYWVWTDTVNLNLGIVQGDNIVPVCYVKDLTEAAMYAEGFHAGREAQVRRQDLSNKNSTKTD